MSRKEPKPYSTQHNLKPQPAPVPTPKERAPTTSLSVASIERRASNIRLAVMAMRARAFIEQVDELIRGGHKSKSIPSGSRAATTPVPVGEIVNQETGRHVAYRSRDQLDEVVIAVRDIYVDNLREIEKRLRQNAELEHRWIPPDPTAEPDRYRRFHEGFEEMARSLRGARIVVCANPNCRREWAPTDTDRVHSARCYNCYRYRRDHNEEERPKHLCEADEERRRGGAA